MEQLRAKISRQDVQLNADSTSREIAENKEVILTLLDIKNFKKFLKRAQQNQWNSYAIATVSFTYNAFFRPNEPWYVVAEEYTNRNYYSYDIYNFLNKIAISEKEKRLVGVIKKIADSYYEHKIKQYNALVNKKKYYLHDEAFDIKKFEAELKRNRKHFLDLADFLMKGDLEGFKKYLINTMFNRKNQQEQAPRINEISLNYKAYYHAFRKVYAKYPNIVEALNKFLGKYNMRVEYKNAIVLCWNGYPAVLEQKNFIDTVRALHKNYVEILDDPSKVLDFHKVIHKYLIFFEASYKAPYVPNGVFEPFLSEDMLHKAAMVEPIFDNGVLHSYIIPLRDFLAMEL